jgi:hypothetical protein
LFRREIYCGAGPNLWRGKVRDEVSQGTNKQKTWRLRFKGHTAVKYFYINKRLSGDVSVGGIKKFKPLQKA